MRRCGWIRIRSVVVLAAVLLALLPRLAAEEAEEPTPTASTESAATMQQHHRKLEAGTTPLETKQGYLDRIKSQHSVLFEPVPELRVLGPTRIPPPTSIVPGGSDDESGENGVVPAEQPKLGRHRPEADAVVAFAAEYPLESYVTFVGSLRESGFDGDIVLAVSAIDLSDPDIREYLSASEHVVVYSPNRTCYNLEGEAVESAKGGSRVCECPGMFSRGDGPGAPELLPDPRPPRTLATLRYELYWLMIQPYRPHSWILVIDARDTFFQSNPFATVPRATDPSGSSGLLYYFGENVDATRIGRSKQNAKWVASSYGTRVGQRLKDKPTICSGATMGERVAVAAYASAIVSESDETSVVLTGADQGFHNFLYYSGKLSNVREIHDIVVFDQGTGIVNNLGAMRTKPLHSWGHGGILRDIHDATGRKVGYQVLNWDGSISPVVHQFDRHKELTKYFATQRGRQFLDDWELRRRNAAADAAAG
jgi:hypothetical protein